VIIAAMVRTKDPQPGSSGVVVISNQVKQLSKQLSRTEDENEKASKNIQIHKSPDTDVKTVKGALLRI
jgi:hypothetical protein